MPSAEFKKKGTFADVVLPALLVHAVNSRFTGMFRAERDSIIKVIYFKEGEIAFASSNQPSDRLGEVLIKRGQLTREQLDMAMSKLEANVSLGRMLVELGYLSPKELLSGAKTQVEEILYSLNTWKEGSYEFTEGPLPPRIVDLKLNTRQVIFQCILQVEDRRWALDQIDSMEAVFAPQPELEEALQHMRLEPDVQQVVSNIDGSNTVRDLTARSQLDEFTVTKIVGALYLLNLTRMTAHEEHGGEYLARFGEESETTTGDSTVIGKPPGSETMPGFAPGFGGASTGSFGGPFGGFDAPTEEATAARSAPSYGGAPSPLEGSLDEDQGEGSTRPGFDDEPLVAPGDEEAGEEIAYEEEGLEEEGGGGGRRLLIPGLVGLVALLLVGGAAAWWFLGRTAPGGGGAGTPIARLSPGPTKAGATPKPGGAASPAGVTGPIAAAGVSPSPGATASGIASPGTTPSGAASPGATPSGVASPGATPSGVASPGKSPSGMASPGATASGVASPGRTPSGVASPGATVAAGTRSPTPAAGTPVAVVAGATRSTTPAVTLPPIPTRTVAGATAIPTAGAVTAGRTPAPVPTRTLVPPTPAAGATRIATAGTPPAKTPGAVAGTTPPVGRGTPAPIATPGARTTPAPRATPIPTRGTAVAAGGAGLPGAATAQAREKLEAGRYPDAARDFQQAARAASGYTVQLEIICQESSIREGLQRAAGSSEYFVLPYAFRGRQCYRAFWGVHASRAAAEEAARSIPPFFRNQSRGRLPIVPLSGVR